MTETNRCPLCGKRRAERFCPAKGEKICAVCCGTEREVTLDCPADCTYLIAAHRYEAEHRPPVAEASERKTPPGTDVPFPKVDVPSHLIYDRQPFLAGLGRTVVNFAIEHRELADPDALTAIIALAETYRTLVSGIYYAKPPDAWLANGLYAALENFIGEYKQQAGRQPGFPAVKDSEVFYLLVFLARVGRQQTNGRPRCRLFLWLLADEFPAAEPAAAAESSRIIIP